MSHNQTYRPWGLLNWLLPKLPYKGSWSVLGCIGTEERSLATVKELLSLHNVHAYRLLRIADGVSRHSVTCQARLATRLVELRNSGGDEACVNDHALNEEQWQIIRELDQFQGIANGNIILDVTSLPKRFFFPILRQLLRRSATEVNNLVVTYAIPRGYTNERLAENFAEWSQLPLFSGGYSKDRAAVLVVGVGFEVLGLQERLETSESGRITKFLLPFPAPVAAFQRSWELLRKLQQHHAAETFDVHRVDVKDISDTFDRLCSVTRNGADRVDLAPFGPKPMSVGMCVFATLTDSQVFYTQPTEYHPDYSFGIAERDGHAEIYAYAIRMQGRDLFSL